MEIYSIGYNHSHDNNFIIDKPNGCGTWLLLLIKTPAIFKEKDIELKTKENSFILFSPETPVYYRAYKDKYIDDWFHLSLNDYDIAMLATLQIPLNTVTELGSITELSSIIRNTTCEFYLDNIYKAEIVELNIKMLFHKIGQMLYSKLYIGANNNSVHFERMQNLRNDIYNMPQNNWTIDEMSNNLFLSRSTFQHTYKRIFGVSAMTDVSNSRLKRVKYLLSATEFSLYEIAEQCGYNSVSYLIRQFTNKYDMSPTEFRACL